MATEWRRIQLASKNTDGGHVCDNTIISARYTFVTFFPKVTIEQFRKGFNPFFVVVIVLQLSFQAPTNPIPYIIVFTLIMVISFIKQGYEDWIRHKADDIVNNRKFFVYDRVNACFVRQKAKRFGVGQIVRLENNDPVPCDILLLRAVGKSSKVFSKCEITTANLDGEPNRKVRSCPSGLSKPGSKIDEHDFMNALFKDNFEIECDEPKSDLYKFSGVLTSNSVLEKSVPLSMDNVLLRGTTLKNSRYIYGCVLYAGSDTRLSLNSAIMKRNKFSLIDHSVNKIVIGLFVFLTILIGIAVGLFFLMREKFSTAWYMPVEDETELQIAMTIFFLFLVFLSYMIPISLAVSMEIQKFGSTFFFGWDNDMVCPKTGARATCNTSDLNEELGQIDYLLTDKTGTLTENNLNFICCSIGKRKFDYNLNPKRKRYELNHVKETDTESIRGNLEIDELELSEYLEAIALCHTVKAGSKDFRDNNENDDVMGQGQIQYQGSSSDEEVLVSTAHALGVSYMGDDNIGRIILQRKGILETYTRHFVLEFDSDRKCMSVIVENNQSKRFFLITKGAESAIFPKCVTCTLTETLEASIDHVNQFAKKGYRTLVIAKKEILSAEVAEIQKEYDQLRRHPEKLQEFYKKVESDLTLLGTTAVEDQLQANVAQTLSSFKEAGIRVWMLTGDKMETAVNIGATCGLISTTVNRQSNAHLQKDITKVVTLNSTIGYLTDATSPELAMEKLVNIRNEREGSLIESTLVVDGVSFAFAFDNSREFLANVALSSSQVIFCRMAPLQKAQVVRLITSTKEGKKSRVCAVGDGGNDVAMIQEAHVGIGILGREGRQAAKAADFALAQFQHLQKAILVHGIWFYYRLATLVAHIFYRCVLFAIPQFFYGFDSGFSGQTVFDTYFLMCYNMLFVSVPIVIYGLQEQFKTPEELLRNPSFYNKFRGNALFNRKALVWWTSLLVWHMFLLVHFPRLVLGSEFEQFDWGMYSHLLNTLLVSITLINVASNVIHFNWILFVSLSGSFLGFLIFYVITSEVLKSPFGGSLQFAYFELVSRSDFWFVVILATALSILPDLVVTGIRRLDYLRQRNKNFIFFPSDEISQL